MNRQRSFGLTVALAPLGQWPTYSPLTHEHWPPPAGEQVCRGCAVCGSACTAGLGPSRGWPGGLSVAFPVAVGEADSPWRGSGTPRPLQRARDEPACGRLWSAPLGGGAPPGNLPRGAVPSIACVRWGVQSGCGRRVRPRGCRPRGTAPRAGPAALRPPGGGARMCPALGVLVRDVAGVPGVRGPRGPMLARPCVAPL
jgi:hypothetical protein